jgi:hypothetical protein
MRHNKNHSEAILAWRRTMSTQATALAVEISSEPAAQPRPKTKSKSLKLKMGRPNGCYENAMRHVFAMPKRLRYVEGFEIEEVTLYPRPHNQGTPFPYVRFNHHAQVLDTVTGRLHEVTPHHSGDEKYVYRTFTNDELVGYDGEGDVLTDPDWWTPQLTLQAQRDLLIEAGYAVELWAVEDDYEHERIASTSPEQMTAMVEQAVYLLNEDKGVDGEPTWDYEWRLKAAAIGAAA